MSICSSVKSLELSDRTNRPKIVEVTLPSRRFSRGCMEKLGVLFSRYAGMDRVEILVRSSSGDTMRLALPARVDAHSPLLLEQVRDVLGQEGAIALV